MSGQNSYSEHIGMGGDMRRLAQDRETKLQALILLLKSHDWFYDYSDDAMMWQRGNRVEKEIQALVIELGGLARYEYNKYAPTKWVG